MGPGQENSDPFDLDDAFEEDELKGRPEVAGHNEGGSHASGTSTCTRVMHQASGEWSLLDEAIMGSDPHNLEEWDNMLVDGEVVSGDVDLLNTDNGDGEATEKDERSLMSNSLEEVDEILRNSGRLDTSTPNRGPAVIHVGTSGPSSCDVATPCLHQSNALGTCSQTADTLKSCPAPSTDPSDVVVSSDVLPNEAIGEHKKKKPIGGSSVQCATSGDTSAFPPRCRQPRKNSYIRADGLALTYTQAKLFGLVVSDSPSMALANVLEATRASTWCVSRGAVETRRSSSLFARRRSRGRTYSESRMEHLARPVLSRGARGAHETGVSRRQEASFTWKRSRKAEAAMRDPACGYDFMRDGTGTGDQNDFLRRVEAYASYNRAKLQAMRAEQEYAARLNKMECPQCRNPQSYDEFANKKLLCLGCDVEYCHPRTWKRKVWEKRNRMYAEQSKKRRERAERQAREVFLESLPRETRHGLLLRQRVGQVDLVRRMRSDLQRRRQREATSGNTDCQQQLTGIPVT